MDFTLERYDSRRHSDPLSTLHSMLLKRQRNTSVLAKASVAHEIELLKSIKVTDQEWDTPPSGIKYLQQGVLDIISPRMLPFLRHVVEKKTASLVNDITLREQGRHNSMCTM